MLLAVALHLGLHQGVLVLLQVVLLQAHHLREGLLLDLDGTIFTATAVEKARHVVREGFDRHGSLTVSQARDLLGSSRKYVLAILAHFDAEGVTRRRGDERFPGPRLGS